MARPRKEFDQEQFKGLCTLHCTLHEIAGFFKCSEDTIERWCERELKMSFADAYKTYSAGGNISLRRYQMKMAEKNATMAIWLGKQYLGQRDNTDINLDVNTRAKEVEALDEYFRQRKQEGDS